MSTELSTKQSIKQSDVNGVNGTSRIVRDTASHIATRRKVRETLVLLAVRIED